MANNEQARLADALEKLAAAMEARPAPIVGIKISQTLGPGGGSMTGIRVNMNAAGGNATGIRISQTAGERDPRELAHIAEVREAATAVKAGKVEKGWLQGLLDRSADVASDAAKAFVKPAAEALQACLQAGL